MSIETRTEGYTPIQLTSEEAENLYWALIAVVSREWVPVVVADWLAKHQLHRTASVASEPTPATAVIETGEPVQVNQDRYVPVSEVAVQSPMAVAIDGAISSLGFGLSTDPFSSTVPLRPKVARWQTEPPKEDCACWIDLKGRSQYVPCAWSIAYKLAYGTGKNVYYQHEIARYFVLPKPEAKS